MTCRVQDQQLATGGKFQAVCHRNKGQAMLWTPAWFIGDKIRAMFEQEQDAVPVELLVLESVGNPTAAAVAHVGGQRR
jgi:Ni2+-binding GTPase involved in maturation of urease and hydrogenase